MPKFAAAGASGCCFRQVSIIGASAVLAASLIAICPRPASASGFNPVLDEFSIVRNGSTIFDDTFGDGSPPPSGPNDLASPSGQTYITSGNAGFSESGGKLTINPSLGDPCTPVTSCGGISDAIRLFGGINSSPSKLTQADSFEIRGLYDISNSLLNLPSLPGETFDIRTTDRGVEGGNNNDRAGLKVVAASSGMVKILFQDVDFSTPTPTFVDVGSTGPLDLSTASTLALILTKAAGSQDVFGSYSVDGGTLQSLPGFVGIYNGENLTRAEFYATAAAATPLPAALPLFAGGAGVLGFFGLRRKKKVAKAAA